MAFTTKDNSGALFKNDEKITDKHPDYQGSVIVGGKAYFISAWLKTSERGMKFMSLAFTPKTKPKTGETADKPATKPTPPPPPPAKSSALDPDADEDEDDIPF